MLRNGDILDGMYQIIQEIGQGGTGIIYLAEHLRIQKRVVVKKIKDNFAGQIDGRARAEVDIMKRLHHTYLPQVYDFLILDSSIYTVMEYIDGQDLQHYLDQGYVFPEETVRKWLLQLSEVLEYLHGLCPPILHSDIKPANIMITSQGNVCLIDFNISLDGENSKDIQGISPWYAAPEQYEKAQKIMSGVPEQIRLDGRMDIYSLGASFYKVMTGMLPQPTGPLPDIAYMDIPYSDGLKGVISKAVRFQPGARFKTAEQMRKMLQDTGRMDPVYKRYGRIQIAGCFAYAFCVIAGVMLLYYGSWQNTIERWQEAYSSLYLVTESQSEAEIVAQATDILNSSALKGYLKKNEAKRAEVLHILGESYFRREQYREAASYYEEAWQTVPEEGTYCKDYVIALVYDNDIPRAKSIMESADGMRNLNLAEKELIEAQMFWMEKDYDGALRKLDEMSVAETMADADVLAEGYLLRASVLTELEEYAEAVNALEKAKTYGTSRDMLRQIGQTAAKAAAKETLPKAQAAFYRTAFECYQQLSVMSHPGYNDRMNLAISENALGKYEDSINTLKQLNQEYPDDYRIPMWMCFNYLELAEKQGSYDSVMEDLRFRYHDSRHSYDTSGEHDTDMENLIEIMNGLGE